MNDQSKEFNTQLALDVLLNGLTEITEEYVCKFNWEMFDEVVIPKGVTKIGDWAFRGCVGLTHITIPDSVTSIGSYVFTSCRILTSLTIPDSVTSIEKFAFAFCTNLINITFEGKTLDEVKAMKDYPWGIGLKDREIISVQVS